MRSPSESNHEPRASPDSAGIESTEAVLLRIDVGLDSDADASEVDEAARALRSQLLELDVQDVRRVTDVPAPEGARGLDLAIGGLVVTAAKEAITAAVRTAASWVSRGPTRSVKITIGEDSLELSSVSDKQQRQLVELFLDRHAGAPT